MKLNMTKFCADGIVGNDPFSVLEPNKTWGNPFDDVFDRTHTNYRRLLKTKCNNPADYRSPHCQFLETLIRHPIYAAIDLLRLKTGAYPSDNGRIYTKGQCASEYEFEFPELAGVIPDLRASMNLRREYRDFLLEREGYPHDYKSLLERIDESYQSAKRFLKANLTHLADMRS